MDKVFLSSTATLQDERSHFRLFKVTLINQGQVFQKRLENKDYCCVY